MFKYLPRLSHLKIFKVRSTCCVWCGNREESTDHFFIECGIINVLWQIIFNVGTCLVWTTWYDLFPASLVGAESLDIMTLWCGSLFFRPCCGPYGALGASIFLKTILSILITFFTLCLPFLRTVLWCTVETPWSGLFLGIISRRSTLISSSADTLLSSW